VSTPPKPIPEITPDLAPFFAAARELKLVVQRCVRCGERRFPARERCSRCLARESEWVQSSGVGAIHSYNVMHQVYHPGFAAEVPYPVVLVELEDGGRVLSNLVDCPREKLRIGLPVEVVFEKLSDEVTLPKFRPRAERS
jgi:uncharacterized protein